MALLIILVCLIVRGVAFEYRAKRRRRTCSRNWRRDLLDLAPPRVLWGVPSATSMRA